MQTNHRAAATEVGEGFEISITRAATGWRATVLRRTNLAGPEVFQLETISDRPSTFNVATTLREITAAVLNDLAEGSPPFAFDEHHGFKPERAS